MKTFCIYEYSRLKTGRVAVLIKCHIPFAHGEDMVTITWTLVSITVALVSLLKLNKLINYTQYQNCFANITENKKLIQIHPNINDFIIND